MNPKRFGRRFSSLEAQETETTSYIIGCESLLLFRTQQDRPPNEDRIRGIC